MATKVFTTDYKINGVVQWTLELTLKETLTDEPKRIATNSTPIDFTLVLKDKTSSYSFSQYKIGRSVTINGAVVHNTARADSESLALGNNGSLLLADGTTSVTHNEDGTKTIAVSYSIDMAKASYTPGPLSGSGTMNLTAIARASRPTLSATAFNMGDKITVKTNRKSTSFTHKVCCLNAAGAWLTDIAIGVKDSVEWDTETLIEKCTNAPSLSGYVEVTTFNGDKTIGEPQRVGFKASVPDNDETRPALDLLINNVGEIVQGKTAVSVTLKAVPQKGASMTKYTVEAGGVQVSTASDAESETLTTAPVAGSGSITVVGYATDSRGITAKEETVIEVTPYGAPYVSAHPTYGVKCFRCDQDGNANKDGEFLRYQFGVTWYSLKSGNNALLCKVRNQALGFDSGWIEIDGGTQYGGGEADGYKSRYVFDGILDGVDSTKSYDITFVFEDTMGASAVPLAFSIPSSSVDFHLGGNKAAFGKYAEYDKTVEIAEDWSLRLNGASVNDHVVETGTSGGWHYRIWNNGIAECFRRYEGSGITLSNNFSGFYYSGTVLVDYPFTFKEEPTVLVNGGSSDRMNFLRTFAGNTKRAGFVVVGVQSQSNFKIIANIYAIGLLEKGE